MNFGLYVLHTLHTTVIDLNALMLMLVRCLTNVPLMLSVTIHYHVSLC